MLRYLFLEELRGLKVLLKNYFLIVSGMIITIILVISLAWNNLTGLRTIIIANMDCVAFAVILFQFMCVFINDKSDITVKPALFHYSFNSECFIKVRQYIAAKILIKDIAVSSAIALLIGGSAYSVIKNMVFFSVYFISASSIRWLRFNHYKLIYCILLFLGASIILQLSSVLKGYILLPFGIAVCCYISFIAAKICPDWGKYNDEIIMTEKINAAGRHMRLAEMTTITNEHLAKGKNKLKLTSLPVNQKNAVICKAAIESWRAFKRLVVFYAAMSAAAVALVKVPFIAEKFFFGHSGIAALISAYLFSGVCVGLIRTFSDCFIVFSEKHKNGFFVPYSHKKIMTDYMTVCVSALTVINIIICLFLSFEALNILISTILVDISAILIFIALENKYIMKNRNMIFALINAILALLLYKLF